ncbi:hypothetical protein HMPREF0044_0588 [Gleimia coleocanis DSM 15436]|uniref:Uncharacterized protein n=1 Tax=Gleimia coleocanis DSM 15436 TaxID=525245 RepID=C0VZJ8_9ACTO|nr:hypothetical protein HMPREF0044_0588 [Gleimia coleocanis DSM 15436]
MNTPACSFPDFPVKLQDAIFGGFNLSAAPRRATLAGVFASLPGG